MIQQINNLNKKINILYDFSNLFYRITYSLEKELSQKAYSDWGIVKHTIFKNIIDFKINFKNPNIIICFDKKDENGKYWRHNITPYYKEGKKWNSPIPEHILYENFNLVVSDIQKYFPWKSILISGIEADDSIGVLTNQFKEDTNIIYSPDKDFTQLLVNENNFLYDPLKNEWRDRTEARKFKWEHIFRGDASDGIPNILSDLDTFVQPLKRQNTLRSTKINEAWDYFNNENGDIKEYLKLLGPNVPQRFIENRKLIDLTIIDSTIINNILDYYNNYTPNVSFKEYVNYCDQNGLIKLGERWNDLI